MTLTWLLASFHLIGLGIGLVAVFVRALAFRDIPRPGAVQRALTADNFWGLSAIILISTGLIRAFAGFEKGSGYYLHSTMFWVKMGLLVLILLLEIRPMTTLIRWRSHLRSNEDPDTTLAPRFARISYIQTGLLAIMISAATAMARGLGY
jgi:putative membrane protein